MTDFQQRYKEKSLRFGGVNEGRLVRFERREQERKQERSRALNRNRNISDSANTSLQNAGSSEPAVEDRLTRLRKWKLEKEKQKRAQSRKQKPPFKVGIVSHKIFSPALRDENVQSVGSSKIHAKPVTVPKPRNKISKATEKRLKAKVLRDATQQTSNPQKNEKSFAPVNHQFKPPIGLSAMTHLRSVAISSMDDTINKSQEMTSNTNVTKLVMQQTPSSGSGTNKSGSPLDPVYFSPYVVSSRGKSNARKEQQIRRGLGSSPASDIPTKDTVMQNLNISIEDEERTAQYFHFLLNKEIERLEEVCNTWEETKTAPDVTEDAQYQIHQAIGQTTLLLKKKFERFRSLVNDCETGKGEMLVTCKDLQGFWDMMYREVRDCDARFEALEKLRARNWIEETPPEVTEIVKKKAVRKKKKAAITTKQSSIRALIMAARKEKKVSDTNILENATTASPSSETSPATKFGAKSRLSNIQARKETPKKENTRRSLLQKVRLSETAKTLRSPLTIMKISKMCRTPEVELDRSVSYVNSDQTPGKSILKKSKEMMKTGSVVKSSHKVNFNENIVLKEVPVDEETQVKVDLARALARIESFDFDSSRTQTEFPVERKLTFDTDESMSDESGDVLHNIDEQKQSSSKRSTSKQKTLLSLPAVSIRLEGPTPTKESSSCNPDSDSPKRNLKSEKENQSSVLNESLELLNNSNTTCRKVTRQDEFDESSADTDHENIRVLRNRSISSKTTPNSTQRRRTKVTTSEPNFREKENKTPLRTKRKSSLKVSVTDSERTGADLVDAMQEISLVENRRRSTRRRVKFTAEDCTGCVQSKPALPMTPHVRRSKSRLSGKEMHTSLAGDLFTFETQNFEGDLISFETPDKLPERVRRSRSRKWDGETSMQSYKG